MKQIPFNDFKKEYSRHKKDIDCAVARVLRSGWFILGKELERLEASISKALHVNYCVGVGNGTDAITLSLLSLNIGLGDEVITSNVTAYPTIAGIERSGATPVVVDVDGRSGLIDPSKIETSITRRTKAIIPVHLYGQACDMDRILRVAGRHKLKVIEDCAQSFSATYKKRPTGSMGIAGTLSFYPTKNLGALGDAGAVVTSDRKMYEKLLQLRNCGQTVRYYHSNIGMNSRLDEIQAALLSAKLKYLKRNIEKRRKIANFYNKKLHVNCVREQKNNNHTYHLYVIKSPQRDRLMDYLKEHGVASIIHYPVPVNKQAAFKHQKKQQFPATEKFTKEILSIPIHPELTLVEAKYIADTINRFGKSQ